ncbi:hypothetical protein [Leptospira kanakyensis]|uniref:hypothetical protein n=1 Tax=Leptospira kanakyensis TaxID=2484968 RepID=UPI00223E54C4|nr:hypothetical protein [Leptospira kanakyensis]MCW7470556.1 hypothetical protein [Leptospira kanakyensis]
MNFSSSGLILDSCVIINLLCSDLFYIFIESYRDIKIAEFVIVKEILPMSEKYSFNLEIPKRKLLVPNEKESEMILELSREIDDGESYSIALAISRGLDLGTDDKKAIRLYESFPNHKKLWNTPELIFRLFGNSNFTLNKQEVLMNIKNKAKFIPSPKNPFYKEWIDILCNN